MRALRLEEILKKMNLNGFNPKKPEMLLSISENALKEIYSALERAFGKSADGYLILAEKYPLILKSYAEGLFKDKTRYKIEKKKY